MAWRLPGGPKTRKDNPLAWSRFRGLLCSVCQSLGWRRHQHKH
jgi:hypothetical protein